MYALRSLRSFLGFTAFALAALTAAPAHADILLQTATLGTTGQTGGLLIDSSEYLAARFQTSQAFTLTSVQIHVDHSGGAEGNGLIFAAIVPLANLSAFPNAGSPGLIADDNPVEVQTFTTPTFSAVVTIPFSASLPAGTYAVVFGSGEFGATGSGAAPVNGTDIGTPSYFFRNSANDFFNGITNNAYYVVNGTQVQAAAAPEPGSLALVGLAALFLTGRTRRYFGGAS